MRRKDDRVSRWFIHNVYRFISEPTPYALGLVALCRWINWPPTIKALMEQNWFGSPLDLPQIGAFIEARTRAGHKTWTGAYMIRAEGTTPKGQLVAETVVGGMLKAFPEIRFAIETKQRRLVHEKLAGLYGWGSFMAGQVVDDLTWTPILRDAADLYTWAPIGPGSTRGLNRVIGRPLRMRFRSEEFCAYLQQAREALLAASITDITLHDVQNCFCEFDKYKRVEGGEGRPRALYHPETAF